MMFDCAQAKTLG